MDDVHVPLVLLLLFISWRILLKTFPFTQKTIELNIEGGMKHGFHANVVIVTFFLTVALWLLDRVTGINSYTVAMIPFAVFALTGVITKRDLEQINWSVIWMVAGGFALGYGLNASGLAANAVESILRRVLTTAHPVAWRPHLLSAQQLHQQLSHSGTAHAHSGHRLRCHGR